MTEHEILARVSAVIGEVLEIDDLALDLATTASEVEDWDSIATVEIVVALEQEFSIRFRTGEMAAFAKVGDLVRTIAERAG
jgi:acyl carrier protein